MHALELKSKHFKFLNQESRKNVCLQISVIAHYYTRVNMHLAKACTSEVVRSKYLVINNTYLLGFDTFNKVKVIFVISANCRKQK